MGVFEESQYHCDICGYESWEDHHEKCPNSPQPQMQVEIDLPLEIETKALMIRAEMNEEIIDYNKNEDFKKWSIECYKEPGFLQILGMFQKEA